MHTNANLKVAIMLSLNTESGVRAPFNVMLKTKLLLHRKQQCLVKNPFLQGMQNSVCAPLPLPQPP